MTRQINILLLYGGKSGEHEISLISAASVLQHLNPERYNVIPVAMDKTGCFYQNDYQEMRNYPKSLPVKTDKSKSLAGLLIDGKLAISADVIFPMVHGPLYEDGCLQGLFEIAGVAYVGSNVLTSAIGMDKDIARRLVCDENIRCARYHALSWHASAPEKQQFCQKISQEFGFPVFVKPCTLGSSVGIHKAKNMEELNAAVEDALRYDAEILVEEFIEGHEVELAVLENPLPTASPLVSKIGEIKVHHADGFYSYAAKYLESDQTELIIPAQLPENLSMRLQKSAAEIFTRLKCRGLARVDFFVNSETGTIYFNEINTLPGFTPISMYPKLWQASGINYSDLLDQLIMRAQTHEQCKRQLVTDYQ